jgi:hypothetical protein
MQEMLRRYELAAHLIRNILRAFGWIHFLVNAVAGSVYTTSRKRKRLYHDEKACLRIVGQREEQSAYSGSGAGCPIQLGG